MAKPPRKKPRYQLEAEKPNRIPLIWLSRPQIILTIPSCITRTIDSIASTAERNKCGPRSSKNGGTKSPRARFIPEPSAADPAVKSTATALRTIRSELDLDIPDITFICLRMASRTPSEICFDFAAVVPTDTMRVARSGP